MGENIYTYAQKLLFQQKYNWERNEKSIRHGLKTIQPGGWGEGDFRFMIFACKTNWYNLPKRNNCRKAMVVAMLLLSLVLKLGLYNSINLS